MVGRFLTEKRTAEPEPKRFNIKIKKLLHIQLPRLCERNTLSLTDIKYDIAIEKDFQKSSLPRQPLARCYQKRWESWSDLNFRCASITPIRVDEWVIKESLLDSILLTCDLERLWVSEAAWVAGEEALVDIRDLWIFFFCKKKKECRLKLDFIWTGDRMSYSRFSGNLCAFCGWRVTFVRVGRRAIVHETIHVFKRDLGRGTQHLGEGSGIFEYLYISFLSSCCCTFEDPPGPLG